LVIDMLVAQIGHPVHNADGNARTLHARVTQLLLFNRRLDAAKSDLKNPTIDLCEQVSAAVSTLVVRLGIRVIL